MKKYAVIILCTALLFPAFSAQAGESANMASGDYEYALNKDGTAIITKYNGSEAAVTIPDVLDRHAVVEVGPRAFQENESLVSLVIPEGIKAINVEAFAMCRNLVSVSLPESLTDIGNAAFYGCENLGAVHLPAKVASIAEQAFNACTSLENFTVSRDSQSFTVNEGVLFDKGGQLLVDYPSGKPGTAYLIPEGTRGISPYAFMGNNSLLSLTLPQSMTEIGDRSFYGINSVESINIPNKVIKIGDSAFSECDSLATFSLPGSVNEIGVSIFYRCDALEQILVDEGSAAFSSRDGVLYDKGMTIVHAYPCAKKDEAFEIPAGETAVADYAFYDASFLKKATVPLGVQTIGWGAFQSCHTLEEAIILDSMTSIGRNAFIQCDKLTLHVWEGSYAHQYAVENPVPYAFLTEYPQSSALDDAQATLPQTAEMTPAPVSDYEYTLNEDGTAVITEYLGHTAEVTVPSFLDGYAVTAIGKEAFMNNAELVGITIPEGVRTIGEWAFGSCRQLTEIRLPASLEALGERAFRSCESLVSFAIPSGLIEIGTGAFDYCTSLSGFTVSAGNPSYQAMDGVLFDTRSNTLVCYPCAKPGTDYSIPEGTKNIAPNAFNYALNLTRITLPLSMTEIGEYAFYNAENLAIIEIPDWTAKIGGYAFYGCRSLKEINIPKGVTDIGRFVFGGCESLTDIRVSEENTAYASWDGILLDKAMTTVLTFPGGRGGERSGLPAGVQALGDGAYSGCHLLVHAEVPQGVTSIGSFAFDGCSGLEGISIPDSVQTIGQCAFRYCNQLKNIRLPAALKEVQFGLFDRCENLVSVELPEGLTAIYQSAFEDCTGLRELVLPDSVTDIGYAAFKGCAGLTSLWVPDSVSTIEEKAFEGCDILTLQVSEGSYAQLYAVENGIPYAFVTGSPPTAVLTSVQPIPAPTTEVPQLPEETTEPSETASQADVSAVPQPTPVLVTDLTPQAEETDVYAEPQDESPYAAAFFNVSYYAQMNPDLVAASGGDEGLLRAHWLNYGIHEGRKGSPSFDAKWYLANFPDLAAVFGSDYARAALHYRSIGVAQGQAGSAEFNAAEYASLNPDLAALYGNDLRALAQHYNDRGFAEGRLAATGAEVNEAPQVETAAATQPDGTPEPQSAADASEPGTANPWPVLQNTLHKLKTIDKGTQRAMAYRGPGKSYREANAFVTSKMRGVYGLFTEGKYILTEMDYAGVGKRRLYFMIGTFTKTGNTPVWDLEGFGAYTSADAFPRYGPGEDYNDFGGEVLPAGSPASVFFEENGWVFMEFTSPQGLDRGWVPSEFVVPAGM